MSEIINFSDIDLCNDLEAVSALISSVDIVISPCTIVGEIAGALNVPTLYLVQFD